MFLRLPACNDQLPSSTPPSLRVDRLQPTHDPVDCDRWPHHACTSLKAAVNPRAFLLVKWEHQRVVVVAFTRLRKDKKNIPGPRARLGDAPEQGRSNEGRFRQKETRIGRSTSRYVVGVPSLCYKVGQQENRSGTRVVLVRSPKKTMSPLPFERPSACCRGCCGTRPPRDNPPEGERPLAPCAARRRATA